MANHQAGLARSAGESGPAIALGKSLEVVATQSMVLSSPPPGMINLAKTRRFTSRLVALKSSLAEYYKSLGGSGRVTSGLPDYYRLLDNLRLVVEDFLRLISNYTPDKALRRAFRTGTDAEAFGLLYERLADCLDELNIPFPVDSSVARSQDLLDESSDLQELVVLLRRTLVELPREVHMSHRADPAATPAEERLTGAQLELLLSRLQSKQRNEGGAEEQPPGAPPVNDAGDGKKRHTFRVCTRPFNVIDRADVRTKELIGKGAWGKVYRAYWHSTEVAVKKLTASIITREAKDSFIHEVEVNSAMDHPGIIQVYGACIDKDPFLMVMEFARHGSLFGFLQKSLRGEIPRLPLGPSIDTLIQISRSLDVLHSVGIAHRDLKSLNVLITDDRTATKGGIQVKLADFGLAKVKTELVTAYNTIAGTYRWMAPEVMRGDRYRASADVYSFGILAFEVLTCDVPFGALTDPQVINAVHVGVRPELPDTVPEKLREIISECWADDPEKRPAFSAVASRLELLPEYLRWQSERNELLRQAEKKFASDQLTELSQIILRDTEIQAKKQAVEAHTAPVKSTHYVSTLVDSGPVTSLLVHEDTVYSAGGNVIHVWRQGSEPGEQLILADKVPAQSTEIWCLLLLPGKGTKPGRLYSGSKDGLVMAWSLSNQRLLRTAKKQAGGILALAGNERMLFSSSDDCSVRILDPRSLALLGTVDAGGDTYALSLRCAGRELLLGMRNGELTKWEVDLKVAGCGWAKLGVRCRNVRTVNAHNQAVASICTYEGEDGKRVVTASWDGCVKVWSLGKLSLKLSIEAHAGSNVLAVLVAGGSIVSSASDKSIKVWDLKTGALRKVMFGHTNAVVALATWGDTLLSGSTDKTIKAWRLSPDAPAAQPQAQKQDTDAAVQNGAAKAALLSP